MLPFLFTPSAYQAGWAGPLDASVIVRATFIPKEKKRCPDGVTNHHLPSTFSVRKCPVAVRCGPFAQPPYSSQVAGAGFSSARSRTRSSTSCTSFVTFADHLSWMNCP